MIPGVPEESPVPVPCMNTIRVIIVINLWVDPDVPEESPVPLSCSATIPVIIVINLG